MCRRIYAQGHSADYGKPGGNQILTQARGHLFAIKAAAPAADNRYGQAVLVPPFTAAVEQRRRLGDLLQQRGVMGGRQ